MRFLPTGATYAGIGLVGRLDCLKQLKPLSRDRGMRVRQTLSCGPAGGRVGGDFKPEKNAGHASVTSCDQ